MDRGQIKDAILSHGFVIIEDPEVGKRVADFRRKQYPFQSEDGLYFLQDTLDDKRTVDLVESLWERSGLGMFKVRGPHAHCARAPLNKTTDEILLVNAVHCSAGTTIVLYENSFNLCLDARPPPDDLDTGLLEISSKLIAEIPGITVVTKTLPDGGLILFDGRFFSTILQGVAIEVGFADEKEIKRWKNKMPYPDFPLLREIVMRMDREKIKINIEFFVVKTST